jgi:3-oxoacyl-[acyl-carrier-protein] synthase-1
LKYEGRLRNELAAAVPSIPADLPATERMTRMGLPALERALAESGRDAAEPGVRLVLGTSLGAFLEDGAPPLHAWADDLALAVGAGAPPISISTACSSSFKALASAIRLIDSGLADAAVVGSADSLCRTTIFGFHSLGLLAPTATRPFARDRDGITLGEGSAYLVIERDANGSRPHAIARVSGTGAASDVFHHTSPNPDGVGPILCMRQALDRAGLTPNEIDYVSAHGTGTKLNDAAEATAVTRVFERQVPVTATKSLTGHTLGSAGLTALILALESLRREQIPASLRATPVDDKLTVAIVDKLVPARVRHVLVNAFGFGGSNASVVLSQPSARRP